MMAAILAAVHWWLGISASHFLLPFCGSGASSKTGAKSDKSGLERSIGVAKKVSNGKLFALCTATIVASILCLDLAVARTEMSDLQGYTLVAKKKVEDDFDGCDYDKPIIFTDGTYLRCDEYGYTYKYSPRVLIFKKGSRLVMCLEDKDRCFKMRID